MGNRVEETWTELNCTVRALGHTVFVRTDPVQTRSAGGIHYAPSETSFYDGPLHMRLVNATVVAAGPKAEPLKLGDRVCFQRKFFTRWRELEDGTFVGWLHISEIAGILDEDTSLDKYISFPEGARAVRHSPM